MIAKMKTMYVYIQVTGGRAFIALFQPYLRQNEKRAKGQKGFEGKGINGKGLTLKRLVSRFKRLLKRHSYRDSHNKHNSTR